MRSQTEAHGTKSDSTYGQNLPDVWKADVLGIVCSDIHFSQNPPLCRMAEPNWYSAMVRPWQFVRHVQNRYSKDSYVPILIAGDLFHRWDQAPASLINLVIDTLPPNCYAIPGQHDLPYHDYKRLAETPYWTVCKAGKLTHLTGAWQFPNGLAVSPFPWGFEVEPFSGERDFDTSQVTLKLALIHSYCWASRLNSHQGASEKAYVRAYNLKGYNVAVFGDNHIPFTCLAKEDESIVFNCGGFMRRRFDEVEHKPRIGLLLKKPPYIIPIEIPCASDVFSTKPDVKGKDIPLTISLEDIFEDPYALDGGASFEDVVYQRLAAINADELTRRLVSEHLRKKSHD